MRDKFGFRKANSARWNMTSNAICHYLREEDHLLSILKNRAIYPRFNTENYEKLNIPGLKTKTFPMICFCDIPFSMSEKHMQTYGQFGIAISKVNAIDKFHIQPVIYCNEHSPYIESLRKNFMRRHELPDYAFDFLEASLYYIKPLVDEEQLNGANIFQKAFQDESEWRYIPAPVDKMFEMDETLAYSKRFRSLYSKYLEQIEEYKMDLVWDDIEYIIVPSKRHRERLIDFIYSLKEYSDHDKLLLVSKIQVSKSFGLDL